MKRVLVPEDCPASPKAQSEAIETEHLLFFAGQLATDYATGVAPEAAVDPENPFAGPPPMARRDIRVHETAGTGTRCLSDAMVSDKVRSRTTEAMLMPCGFRTRFEIINVSNYNNGIFIADENGSIP